MNLHGWLTVHLSRLITMFETREQRSGQPHDDYTRGYRDALRHLRDDLATWTSGSTVTTPSASNDEEPQDQYWGV